MAFVLAPAAPLCVARSPPGKCARRRHPVAMCATPPEAPRDWQKHDDADADAGSGKNGDVPLELVEGFLDNARIRPKIDLDANEYMLMWKLRRMLHEDDFNRIFDKKDRRIGDF